MWGCTGSLRTRGSEADPQLHPSVTRRQQQEQTAVELTFWCLKNKGRTSSFSFHYCTWQWCVPDLEIWTAKSGSNSSLLIWETGSRYAAAKCPLWTVRTARAQFQTNAHSGNPQGKRKYEQCVWTTCVCVRARVSYITPSLTPANLVLFLNAQNVQLCLEKACLSLQEV